MFLCNSVMVKIYYTRRPGIGDIIIVAYHWRLQGGCNLGVKVALTLSAVHHRARFLRLLLLLERD